MLHGGLGNIRTEHLPASLRPCRQEGTVGTANVQHGWDEALVTAGFGGSTLLEPEQGVDDGHTTDSLVLDGVEVLQIGLAVLGLVVLEEIVGGIGGLDSLQGPAHVDDAAVRATAEGLACRSGQHRIRGGGLLSADGTGNPRASCQSNHKVLQRLLPFHLHRSAGISLLLGVHRRIQEPGPYQEAPEAFGRDRVLGKGGESIFLPQGQVEGGGSQQDDGTASRQCLEGGEAVVGHH